MTLLALRDGGKRAQAAAPYARELTRAVSAVATFSNVDHALTVEPENPTKAAILIVTSDRKVVALDSKATIDGKLGGRMRIFVSGGAPLSRKIGYFFDLLGFRVLEGYGLSETSPVASFNHPDRERKPGSIGTPIDGVDMQVWDDDGNEVPQGEVGEIVIRGHNVMKGYWERSEATEEAIDDDGWFRTGDMAKVDEDGYFFIVDRKKDLIIRGGYNVYPREVEDVLYTHPAVAEAAVVGVPDDRLGHHRQARGGRHLHLVAGGELGGLEHLARGVALDGRLGPGDLALQAGGQFDGDGLAFVEHHFGGHAFLEVVQGVAHVFLLDFVLVVLGVHADVHRVGEVGVGALLLVEHDLLHLVVGLEHDFGVEVGDQALELHAHGGGAAAAAAVFGLQHHHRVHSLHD